MYLHLHKHIENISIRWKRKHSNAWKQEKMDSPSLTPLPKQTIRVRVFVTLLRIEKITVSNFYNLSTNETHIYLHCIIHRCFREMGRQKKVLKKARKRNGLSGRNVGGQMEKRGRFDLYKFMADLSGERTAERITQAQDGNPTALMILIVYLCRGLRESGRGAGLDRTWNGSGCGFAGRRILGRFRPQGQEGSRGSQSTGPPSIRRSLRRSG